MDVFQALRIRQYAQIHTNEESRRGREEEWKRNYMMWMKHRPYAFDGTQIIVDRELCRFEWNRKYIMIAVALSIVTVRIRFITFFIYIWSFCSVVGQISLRIRTMIVHAVEIIYSLFDLYVKHFFFVALLMITNWKFLLILYRISRRLHNKNWMNCNYLLNVHT